MPGARAWRSGAGGPSRRETGQCRAVPQETQDRSCINGRDKEYRAGRTHRYLCNIYTWLLYIYQCSVCIGDTTIHTLVTWHVFRAEQEETVVEAGRGVPSGGFRRACSLSRSTRSKGAFCVHNHKTPHRCLAKSNLLPPPPSNLPGRLLPNGGLISCSPASPVPDGSSAGTAQSP